jgi:hypothetical protein
MGSRSSSLTMACTRAGSSSSLAMTGRTSPFASSTVPSPPVPLPPGHEGWISLTSNTGFSGMKSMWRLRHVEEGEHLPGEEHFVLLG